MRADADSISAIVAAVSYLTTRRNRHVRSATRSTSSASSVPTGARAATIPLRWSFQSFGRSSGRTGESDRSPWITAFIFAAFFPLSVFGPVESLPLVRFVSSFASVVMMLSSASRRLAFVSIPLRCAYQEQPSANRAGNRRRGRCDPVAVSFVVARLTHSYYRILSRTGCLAGRAGKCDVVRSCQRVTSTVSVPIALDEASWPGCCKPGDTMLLVAFGGPTWRSAGGALRGRELDISFLAHPNAVVESAFTAIACIECHFLA